MAEDTEGVEKQYRRLPEEMREGLRVLHGDGHPAESISSITGHQVGLIERVLEEDGKE